MTEKTINLNLDGLKNITAMFRKFPKIQVGIQNSSRSGGGIDNPTLGAIHEFGTSKIPARSFLRGPLTQQLPKALKKAKLLSKDELRGVIREKNGVKIAQNIANIAVDVVHQAFDTDGFGQWASDTPSTMAHKHGNHILVETSQLRDSIVGVVK